MKHRQITDELEEQASLFAAGALTEAERLIYLRHLDTDECEVCRDEAMEMESVVHSLAMVLPSPEPRASVKANLMAQVEAGAASSRNRVYRSRFVEWGGWLAAAGSIAVLVLVLTLNANLRREINALTGRVAELETQVGRERTTLASLTAPEVRIVNLAGQGPAPQARGRIFWDEAARRWWFYAYELPPAAPDRSYQLWFVPVSGNPVSAQVFNTSPEGTAQIEIPAPQDIADFQAAAVTSEPAGGLPQPSGPFVLTGTLE